MRYSEKFQLKRREYLRRLTPTIPRAAAKRLLLVAYVVGFLPASLLRAEASAFSKTAIILSPLMEAILNNLIAAYAIIGGICLAIIWFYPFGRIAAQDKLQSIGMCNYAGMVPELIRKRPDSEHPKATYWEFISHGIPLHVWQDKQLAIEAALDINIVSIKYGKNKNRIILRAVPSQSDLPTKLTWKDSYLSPESFVLTLGESFLGPVSVNLAKVPHILLGGSTGSGKSVLLKLLLMQCIRKNAVICIADFKGGVDFPPVWHKKCHMCFTEDSLLYHLEILVDELERRKKAFQYYGVPNIDEFNKVDPNPMRRMVFACDEVAELLDKTGLNKDEKAIISKIEACLSTIARQGRAFGIHLILATQRPDATIIPGQIRNNLDIRICGRADNVLSQIILDSTAAADHIPKDIGGRFMLYDETVFQAYWFDENNL